MNRRAFLSSMVGGLAVAAAASSLPFRLLTSSVATPMLAEYADYANFSSFAIASAIDEQVSNAAAELNHRAGITLGSLYSEALLNA